MKHVPHYDALAMLTMIKVIVSLFWLEVGKMHVKNYRSTCM